MTQSSSETSPFPFCQMTVQGGKSASCAACCGMYNWRGFNRDMVRDILSRQTRLFHEWDGTERGIAEIKKELAHSRPQALCGMIHNCEFIGFLDEKQTQVGCLAHPSQNQGRNLREFSRHGRETCDEDICTAYHYLGHALARCVAAAVPDWYLYGLCITDIDLVKNFFAATSEHLHETVSPERVIASPVLLELFRDYLCLKGCWPFARDPGRFGKYYFPDGTFRIARIDYQRWGMSSSRHDGILLSLGSTFRTKDELLEAEALIEKKVKRFVSAYASELVL